MRQIARSGPSLELWHTTELTEEFTVERADEIQTFTDYRRLEERLFTQMDREVYAHTKTGPTFELARYSTGSAVDLRGRNLNWNQSFELIATAPVGGDPRPLRAKLNNYSWKSQCNGLFQTPIAA